MVIMYTSFALFSIFACDSKDTATAEDTYFLENDTAITEPSADTHTAEPDTQEPADTSTPQGPPFSIFSSEPAYGPTVGGTNVHILGEDFPEDLIIFVGTQEALILSQDESNILIRTPRIESQGSYTIQIQSQEGTVSHSTPFEYYETAEGKTGILGSFDIQQQLGTYWEQTPPSFDARLIFITAQDISWWNLSTVEFDTCTHIDNAPVQSIFPLDISAPFLELFDSHSSLSLVWDSFYNLYEEDSNDTILPNDQNFSLTIPEGQLRGMAFPNFVHTSEPSTLLQPNLDSDSPASIIPNQTFVWEPSGATWISLRLARLDPISGTYAEQVRCTLHDDGFYTLRPDIWTEWIPQQQIDIYFSRTLETVSIAPHNLSQARIASSYTLVGAAFTEEED